MQRWPAPSTRLQIAKIRKQQELLQKLNFVHICLKQNVSDPKDIENEAALREAFLNSMKPQERPTYETLYMDHRTINKNASYSYAMNPPSPRNAIPSPYISSTNPTPTLPNPVLRFQQQIYLENEQKPPPQSVKLLNSGAFTKVNNNKH